MANQLTSDMVIQFIQKPKHSIEGHKFMLSYFHWNVCACVYTVCVCVSV